MFSLNTNVAWLLSVVFFVFLLVVPLFLLALTVFWGEGVHLQTVLTVVIKQLLAYFVNSSEHVKTRTYKYKCMCA